jgi:autotransporter-associated beta strand protein
MKPSHLPRLLFSHSRAAFCATIFYGCLAMSDSAPAATKYFDSTSGAGNGVGGSGTLSSQSTALYSNASTGDATLSSAAATDNGIFQGTSGTVTFSGAYTLSSATFNVSNYVLTTSSTTARVFSAPITLAASVNLNLINVGTDTQLGIASVSGGSGSTLTIEGSQTGSSSARVNLAVASSTVSVPTTISGTGTSLAGFVAVSTGENITNTISNNSSFTTMLGATTGNDLTLGSAATISGTAGVQFSAGSSGGSGTVTINSSNTYMGATTLNNGPGGIIRIGIDNALPDTALQFGVGSNNTGALDLNGHTQMVGSLAVTGTGTINGITNTAATMATLIVNGSATTAYSGIIGIPTVTTVTGATNNIALTLASANTGTQTLSGASTYTGNTTINGGSLLVTNTSGSATGMGNITVDGSGSLFGGSGSVSGTVTVGSAGKGGTISAGAGIPTTVTTLTTGALTLASTSTFNAIVAGNSAYGTLSASGTTNVSNAAFTITVPSGTTLTNGETLTLITSPVTGQFSDSTFSAGGYNFTADYLTNGEFGVDVSAVPEPATFFGGALLLGVLGWNHRRRLRGLFGTTAIARLA